MRETDRKTEESLKKMYTPSHCGCLQCLTLQEMTVLGTHTMVLSPLYTWPELEHIQDCRSGSPLLLFFISFSSLIFLPMGVSSQLPLLQAPFAALHQTSKYSHREFINKDIDTQTPINSLSDIMVHVIKTTTLVFGCKDSKSLDQPQSCS